MSIFASMVRVPDSNLSRVVWLGNSSSGVFDLPDNADSLVYYNTILANMGSLPNSWPVRSVLRFAAYYASPLATGGSGYHPGLRLRVNLVDDR